MSVYRDQHRICTWCGKSMEDATASAGFPESRAWLHQECFQALWNAMYKRVHVNVVQEVDRTTVRAIRAVIFALLLNTVFFTVWVAKLFFA